MDVADLKKSKDCFEYLKLIGALHISSIEDHKVLEEKQIKRHAKLCKLVQTSLNKSIDQEDEDEVFHSEPKPTHHEQKLVKKNVQFEKSMSLDRIDFSNQTDLSKDVIKKNTSENLILAIKPKSSRSEQPKKILRIFRDRSAQTIPIYSNSDLNEEKKNEIFKDYEEEFENYSDFSDDSDIDNAYKIQDLKEKFSSDLKKNTEFEDEFIEKKKTTLTKKSKINSKFNKTENNHIEFPKSK